MVEERPEGDRRGDRVRARRGDRRGQEGGRGHRPGSGADLGNPGSADPQVPHVLPGAAADGGLVGRPRRHPRGDGGDRGVHALCEADSLEVVLVNARHVKNVPGRKTDVKDSEWLAQLLECGLLRGSFIPPKEIAAIRELTRYRKKTIQARTRELQRLSKVLEDAGIKIDSVASSITTLSART